jgi:peptidoglycan/LPS O-acetylase OafA/YrhL
VAIIGVGPTGFWIELYSYFTSSAPKVATLRTSFVSFVPAFVAGTTLQLIWAENEKRALRAFAILILSACMLGLVFCASNAIPDNAAVIFGSLSAAVAFWMWWIANANQGELMDQRPDDSHTNPIGGDHVDVPLAGDLNGFQT